jgi:UDP-glucuronate 4-epimerase
MGRYVVTGAAGFIGSHLTEALLEAGHDVVAVDAFTDHYSAAVKEQNSAAFDVQRLDLAEADLNTLLADADGVFHLAARPSVRSGWGDDFQDHLRDNVLATQRVFAAAAARGVRVVWASSSSVYGEAASYPTPEDAEPRPISPYGVTKLACERIAHTFAHGFGLDAVALRYFTVYGPRQRPDMAFARVVDALVYGRTFELYGDGTQSRGFTYVDDAVAATLRGMEAGPAGAVYNVGGGSEATMLEAIEILERVSGRALDLVVGEPSTGDVKRTSPDTSCIRADLGWAPRVVLEDGLAAQWEWAAARVAAP